MTEPTNWQEMQEVILQELQAKAAELRERAEAVEKLANDFHSLSDVDWWPDSVADYPPLYVEAN